MLAKVEDSPSNGADGAAQRVATQPMDQLLIAVAILLCGEDQHDSCGPVDVIE